MNFPGILSSLKLEYAGTDAFIGIRDMVWIVFVRRDRNDASGSSRRTEESRRAWLLFISHIVSREAPTIPSSDIGKWTHNYLLEERLKENLCTVYEDLFPFIWYCPCPALAFRRQAAQMKNRLSPVLGKAKSVLPRSTPITVIVEIFHVFQ